MSRAAALSGGEPLIRDARLDDAPAIARLWHDGWQDAHTYQVPHALMSHRDAAGFVRVNDDEIEQVFVDRPYRGGSVSSALMRAGETLLAPRGIRTAFLVVDPKNERAIAFYEKIGWARVGLVDYGAETAEGNFTMSILRMEKSVSPYCEDR